MQAFSNNVDSRFKIQKEKILTLEFQEGSKFNYEIYMEI